MISYSIDLIVFVSNFGETNFQTHAHTSAVDVDEVVSIYLIIQFEFYQGYWLFHCVICDIFFGICCCYTNSEIQE